MDIFIPQGAESMLWKLWTDRFDLIFNKELPQIIIKDKYIEQCWWEPAEK
jgi:hypothetical protein